MSIVEVEALGRRLQDVHAVSVRDVVNEIERLVGGTSSGWVGRDGDAFRSWWPEKRTRLLAMADDLSGFGQSALNNAQEQTSASGANGAAGGASARAGAVGMEGGLQAQIDATRASMQSELERLRQERALLTRDGGPEEFLKGIAPGIDSDSEKVRSIEARIARLEALLADPSRSFLKIDVNGDGRLIEVHGDLATADHVAIYMPGISTDIDTYASALGADSNAPGADPIALHQAMQAAAPGESVAVITYLDWDPPAGIDSGEAEFWLSAGERRATVGAQNLSGFVQDLRASGFSKDQLSVVAHSYGSSATGIALQEYGLDVGRVAVVGSPGLGADVRSITDLGRPDVDLYAGEAAFDYVSPLATHGEDPATVAFGARRFSTGGSSSHGNYFKNETESLQNLGRIAVGRSPTGAGMEGSLIPEGNRLMGRLLLGPLAE